MFSAAPGHYWFTVHKTIILNLWHHLKCYWTRDLQMLHVNNSPGNAGNSFIRINVIAHKSSAFHEVNFKTKTHQTNLQRKKQKLKLTWAFFPFILLYTYSVLCELCFWFRFVILFFEPICQIHWKESTQMSHLFSNQTSLWKETLQY